MNLYRLSIEADSDRVKITHNETRVVNVFEYDTILGLDSNMSERGIVSFIGCDKEEESIYLDIISTEDGISIDITNASDDVLDSTYFTDKELKLID